MSSYASLYRLKHPEWREAEKVRNNDREKAKYNNDPEYKEKVKKNALARYYRLKEMKNKTGEESDSSNNSEEQL
jgi:hypothetical protein